MVGPGRLAWPTSDVDSAPFLALEGFSTLKPWRRHHSHGESHSHQEAIHKLDREEGDLRRGIDHLEGSINKWRRRKTPSEG
jgi:hypothetical protein